MAFPFGGHPTFGQYLEWARTQGCQAQSGVVQSDEGIASATRLVNTANGKSVVVPEIKQDERLAPTMIGYLDRRLGLKSHWFSPDE